MRNRFANQLNLLNTELTDMGLMCKKSINLCVEYLTLNTNLSYEDVYDVEKEIDQKERDIESLCMKLLLLQQPVASDLRIISSALKMISDMERIGDQAADIADITRYVKKIGIDNKLHIARMADETIKMVSNSIKSFVDKDISLAKAVIEHDDIVDSLFDEIKQELIVEVRENKSDAQALLDMVMIAKYFERIGDHAENIAEWVIYSITGKHRLN